MDKREVLRTYYGYNEFKQGQEQLVDCILSGRDCLGVMPTGAGKSVCFQVPALMMNGVAIVVSPLISLMQDQVDALQRGGINAVCINSAGSYVNYDQLYYMVTSGNCKLIYVAPERLDNPYFSDFCKNINISLIAVDEAHCVSRWGQDFRPSYLNIAPFVETLSRRPVIAAFTATATDRVKQDISEMLRLQNPLMLTTGFDRPNLYFEVRTPDSKESELLKILRGNSGSTIVYCLTRKKVESVCDMLNRNGIKAVMYHAGMEQNQRKQAQYDFQYDRVDVIVATNAFGMGIDKSNVSLVVHYNMPMDLESYYQEAGRAGRDGSPARCILMYSYEDVSIAEYMIDKSHEDVAENDRQALIDRDMSRLQTMKSYCKTDRCLRSYILGYFGEKSECKCGNCGNCNQGIETVEITVDAQKILSCIFRLKQRDENAGKSVICGILLGRKDYKKRYESLSTFGIMKDSNASDLSEEFDFLVKEGYIENGESCVLTEKSDEFIRSKGRILMHRKYTIQSEILADEEINPELFNILKAQRKKFAASLGVPPYVIMSDAVLRDMCVVLPREPVDLKKVRGLGTIKAERYGAKFLKIINDFVSEHPEVVS